MRIDHKPDFAAQRAAALERVERQASELRGRKVTLSAGLAEVHQAKRAEAEAVLSGAGGKAPLLVAEAQLRGVSLVAMAGMVVEKSRQGASVEIETARIERRLRIKAAQTVAEIEAVADMPWPDVTEGERK